MSLSDLLLEHKFVNALFQRWYRIQVVREFLSAS